MHPSSSSINHTWLQKSASSSFSGRRHSTSLLDRWWGTCASLLTGSWLYQTALLISTYTRVTALFNDTKQMWVNSDSSTPPSSLPSPFNLTDSGGAYNTHALRACTHTSFNELYVYVSWRPSGVRSVSVRDRLVHLHILPLLWELLLPLQHIFSVF